MNESLNLSIPRRKAHSKRPRPTPIRQAFHFDFTHPTGFSRKPVDDWHIAGFDNQPIDLRLENLATFAGRPLSAVETDWLVFASSIYAADRFSTRRPGGPAGPTHWRRSINLTVPVVDVAIWDRAKPFIISALGFLTDDDWSIDFTERHRSLAEEEQYHLCTEFREPPAWICLFSGGLDSLAGFRRLTDSLGSNGVLVSGWTHERLRASQSDIIANLRSTLGSRFDWLPIHYSFPRIINHGSMESSQRSRGWIHVAMGISAAVVSNLNVLDVCENAVGAFNLPTELSQTGSHTSRAMHPVFLHRIAQAAGVVFARDLKVRQTAVFETKGELLAHTLRRDEDGLAAMTFSCEIFPNYHSKQAQCGVCPSCLVRRASLHAAGIKDPRGLYSIDVQTQVISPRNALGLIKMDRYAARLSRCFHPASSADAAMWEYPEAGSFFEEAAESLGMSLGSFLVELRRAHQAFVLEWEEFACTVPCLRRVRQIAA